MRLVGGRTGDSHSDSGETVGVVTGGGGALTGVMVSAAVLLALTRIRRAGGDGDPEERSVR